MPHHGMGGLFSSSLSGPPPLTSSCSRDSSGTVGYGAYCQGQWFNGRWTTEQLQHSIQWKELYPIVLAVVTWGHRWSTLSISFRCDNQAVVQCLVSGTSHCLHLMSLRNIFLTAAMHNLPYLHNTFPVRTTLLLTLFLVSTCRCSAHMSHKPRPTQPPSPLLFPSTGREALPAPLPCHIHTQHLQCSHTQFHHIHPHIQPTPPQRITHTDLGTNTHALRLIPCTHPKASNHKGVPLCGPQHAPGARAPRPPGRCPQPPPLDARNQAGAWLASGPQTAHHTKNTLHIPSIPGALAPRPPNHLGGPTNCLLRLPKEQRTPLPHIRRPDKVYRGVPSADQGLQDRPIPDGGHYPHHTNGRSLAVSGHGAGCTRLSHRPKGGTTLSPAGWSPSDPAKAQPTGSRARRAQRGSQ